MPKCTSIFFNWWWAAITGIFSLLPFLGFSGSAIMFTNTQVSLAIFAIFTLIFLTISVSIQGYKWYTNAQNNPKIEACIPAASSTELEVFQVRSIVPLEPGQIISVLRTTNRGTGCLGIIKVERVIDPLVYQCIPVWIAPIHKNDIAQNQVHVSQLKASLLLNEADLQQFAKWTQNP